MQGEWDHTRNWGHKHWVDRVGLDGLSLTHVPEKYFTLEVCFAAVQRRGCQLKYVPETAKSEEMCLAAVEQDIWAIEYVPEEAKTEKICRYVFNILHKRWLKYVPKKILLNLIDESDTNIEEGGDNENRV